MSVDWTQGADGSTQLASANLPAQDRWPRSPGKSPTLGLGVSVLGKRAATHFEAAERSSERHG